MKEYIGYKDATGDGMCNMGLTDEEIIRCRDCKFLHEDATPNDPDGRVNFCSMNGIDFEGTDGYCAWAVRRSL